MWERFKTFIRTLRETEDIEEMADEIITFLEDEEIDADIRYGIELVLYRLMDCEVNPEKFRRKAASQVRKRITASKQLILFDEEEFFDGDRDHLDFEEYSE